MPEKMQHFFNHFDYAALLQNAIRIAIIVVVAIAIWLVIRYLINRFAERLVKKAEARGHGVYGARERADTISSLLRKVIAAVYWVAVILTLLSQIGVNIGALVAGAGVVGLAVAFGAQQLVKNYISGFFMVLEDQIRVGDVVQLNGTWGTVESLNFRTTVLRASLDGTVHVFSNGAITELSNHTKGWGGYLFKLHVGYKEDTDKVIEVLQQVGKEMKEDKKFGANMTDDIQIDGVNALTDSGVEIRGMFKTTPMNQWSTGREFLARVKRAFDKERISFAFPHQTVFFDEAHTPPELTHPGKGDEAGSEKPA
ncbi:MAG: mechanosensitive ion channel family protein [Gammaproteobacteria bacterium]